MIHEEGSKGNLYLYIPQLPVYCGTEVVVIVVVVVVIIMLESFKKYFELQKFSIVKYIFFERERERARGCRGEAEREEERDS